MAVGCTSPRHSAVQHNHTLPRHGLRTASAIAAAFALIPFAYLLTAHTGPRLPFIMLSLATAIFGTTVFLRHGGRDFTATGIYYLAIAVFGGLAGLLIGFYSQYTIDSSTVMASAVLYVTSIATYYLFLNRRPTRKHLERLALSSHVDKPVPRALPWLGPGALLLAICLSFLNLPIGPLAEELAYCAVLLIAATLLSGRQNISALRQPSFVLLTAGAVVGYVMTFFSGYGRLNLATIALALTIAYTIVRSSRNIKVRLLMTILPFLVIAGAIGATRTTYSTIRDQRSTYDVRGSGDVLSTGSGLESAMSPLARSAELIRIDRRDGPLAAEIGGAHGETFLVALIPWLPRSWWPDKPYGFGRELAILLTPYDDLHSEAALTLGEWYYNFGYLGFLLMVPLHGATLARLDRLLLRETAHARRSSTITLRCLVLVVLTAGVADYVWMGAFTYMSRAGIRALILGGFIVVLARGRRVTSPRPRSTPQIRSEPSAYR